LAERLQVRIEELRKEVQDFESKKNGVNKADIAIIEREISKE
jgi:hypothetical protein